MRQRSTSSIEIGRFRNPHVEASVAGADRGGRSAGFLRLHGQRAVSPGAGLLTLAPFAGRARILSSIGELAEHPLPGIAFGNEVLDALLFQVGEWQGTGWNLCQVGCGPDGGFCWKSKPAAADPALAAAVAPLGSDFPVGYRSEVRTG